MEYEVRGFNWNGEQTYQSQPFTNKRAAIKDANRAMKYSAFDFQEEVWEVAVRRFLPDGSASTIEYNRAR